jgi:REP element-mobilizing transposase RayT
MPNHIHCIIEITEITDVGSNIGTNVGANNHSPTQTIAGSNVGTNGGPNVGANLGANNYSPLQSPPTSSQSLSPPLTHGTSKTIGSIVRGFKIGVTKWFRKNTNIYMVWQRNYYEHIIRDEKSYQQILEYIQTNPLKWEDDQYNE